MTWAPVTENAAGPPSGMRGGAQARRAEARLVRRERRHRQPDRLRLAPAVTGGIAIEFAAAARTGDAARDSGVAVIGRLGRFHPGASIEHDPEKWIPVFGKDHAPPLRESGMTIREKS